jgi:PAS domain S-box-containing protein
VSSSTKTSSTHEVEGGAREYDPRVVASDRPFELESFLGTVPGMVYRSRLAPEPYFIEFVSDEMTSIAGYSATDFVGPRPKRSWAELIHPEDRDASRAKLLEAPTDGSITEVEYRVRRADGSYAWILSRFRKLAGQDGSLWVHGAALDVTARHEAEDLRRRLESERARGEALQESRARIVEAGDEARRRLERDLHDGAQQRLIVSLMTLRRAAKEVGDSSASLFLEQGIEHLEHGIAELRELARGIHPSHLSEHGLAHAVGLLAARTPLPVEVDVLDERLSQPVETTIYFTVAEGLTNVAKYAGATHASVNVTLRDGVVLAEIADDGRGGASASGGSGLRGLADRLEAMGGSLEVESPAGGGTVLRARLPVEESVGGR